MTDAKQWTVSGAKPANGTDGRYGYGFNIMETEGERQLVVETFVYAAAEDAETARDLIAEAVFKRQQHLIMPAPDLTDEEHAAVVAALVERRRRG